MNFEEQILEAAKSIAAATSALVKAASAAQRELVAQGKVRQDESGPLKPWKLTLKNTTADLSLFALFLALQFY